MGTLFMENAARVAIRVSVDENSSLHKRSQAPGSSFMMLPHNSIIARFISNPAPQESRVKRSSSFPAGARVGMDSEGRVQVR